MSCSTGKSVGPHGSITTSRSSSSRSTATKSCGAKHGEAGLGRILREFVAVIRAKTRRVNTVARIQDGQFCLLIPEGDRAIAVRLADQLRVALEEHPYAPSQGAEIVRLAVNIGVGASEGGKDDRTALLAQARQGLEQSRNERRISGFKA